MYKLIVIFLASLFCMGCASIIVLPPIIESASWIKLGVDVVSYVETDKTTTDHALTYITGKDCNTLNVLSGKSLCVPSQAIK